MRKKVTKKHGTASEERAKVLMDSLTGSLNGLLALDKTLFVTTCVQHEQAYSRKGEPCYAQTRVMPKWVRLTLLVCFQYGEGQSCPHQACLWFDDGIALSGI